MVGQVEEGALGFAIDVRILLDDIEKAEVEGTLGKGHSYYRCYTHRAEINRRRAGAATPCQPEGALPNALVQVPMIIRLNSICPFTGGKNPLGEELDDSKQSAFASEGYHH